MKQFTRERFAFEPLSDGALLLDLESGTLFRLNSTAAFVWERALSGSDRRDIVTAFVEAFNVSDAIARIDVSAALDPPRDEGFSPPQTDTLYELIGDSYRFSMLGVPVLEIAASGRSVRVLKDFTPSELYFHLKTVSPKLVALLGAAVLHASAVRHADGRVIAFLGASGAGKTTTARAFAAAGLSVICEDKLILRREADRMTAVLEGEKQIEEWLREAGSRLSTAGTGCWCDLGSLNNAANGTTATLGEIVFIDAARRKGKEIDLQRVGQSGAAAEIFQHAFYGSFDRTQWPGHVSVAAALARTTHTFSATMPDGTKQLAETARDHRYTDKMQS